MSFQQVLDAILGQLGVLVLLLVILWAGWRGYWVFGWYATEQRQRIKDLEARLDRATVVAQGGTGLARRATALAEQHRTEVAGE